MPLNFTVHYDDRANDIDDVSGDIDSTALIGPVYFIPGFTPGARVPAPEYDPRSTGFAFRAFAGYIDTDGRLKNERGGTPGVRLWANDPVFELERLQYQVRADLTDSRGRRIPFTPFYFNAPDEDKVVDLARHMPRPGQSFGRGPDAWQLVGAEFDPAGDIVFINEDGSTLSPIELADDTIMVVDNGDGTLSVSFT